MVDIAFEPKALEVARSETLRFVFRNRGKLPHDAFIGDASAQADHEEEMREAEGTPWASTTATAPRGVTVDPGEVTHTFDREGTLEIGWHQTGHYAAGMKVVLTVS